MEKTILPVNEFKEFANKARETRAASLGLSEMYDKKAIVMADVDLTDLGQAVDVYGRTFNVAVHGEAVKVKLDGSTPTTESTKLDIWLCILKEPVEFEIKRAGVTKQITYPVGMPAFRAYLAS